MKTITLKIKLKDEKEFRALETMIYGIIDQMQGDINQEEEGDDYTDEKITLRIFEDMLKQTQNQK